MFGFFKKKKEEEPSSGLHYDPTNISIRDIRRGWVFDYDGSTWEALEEFEYDWGSDRFSYGFLLQDDKGEQLYMEIDENRGFQCMLYKFVDFNKLPDHLAIAQAIERDGRPLNEVFFENRYYTRANERPCFFRNLKENRNNEIMIWEYWEPGQEYQLRIEQWGEQEFEAFVGWRVYEDVFANILPKDPSA